MPNLLSSLVQHGLRSTLCSVLRPDTTLEKQPSQPSKTYARIRHRNRNGRAVPPTQPQMQTQTYQLVEERDGESTYRRVGRRRSTSTRTYPSKARREDDDVLVVQKKKTSTSTSPSPSTVPHPTHGQRPRNAHHNHHHNHNHDRRRRSTHRAPSEPEPQPQRHSTFPPPSSSPPPRTFPSPPHHSLSPSRKTNPPHPSFATHPRTQPPPTHRQRDHDAENPRTRWPTEPVFPTGHVGPALARLCVWGSDQGCGWLR